MFERDFLGYVIEKLRYNPIIYAHKYRGKAG